MRFLHTADWHIGKTLYGRSLLDEQEQVIEQIIALAHDRTPNVIVIAGDLFDHPSPGADAQKLCYSAIRRLSAVSPVVIIPGNHDAADSRPSKPSLTGAASTSPVEWMRS